MVPDERELESWLHFKFDTLQERHAGLLWTHEHGQREHVPEHPLRTEIGKKLVERVRLIAADKSATVKKFFDETIASHAKSRVTFSFSDCEMAAALHAGECWRQKEKGNLLGAWMLLPDYGFWLGIAFTELMTSAEAFKQQQRRTDMQHAGNREIATQGVAYYVANRKSRVSDEEIKAEIAKKFSRSTATVKEWIDKHKRRMKAEGRPSYDGE